MSYPSASLKLPDQLTIRLEGAVAAALAIKAAHAGQEPADFATDAIARAVRDAMPDQNAGRRLDAELALKARVIELARRLSPPSAFDPDVTLKVFQTIGADPDLRQLYVAAVGRSLNERGQHTDKSRINREIGATVKSALGARIQTIDGIHPVKVQVSKQLMYSYTRLQPAPQA